jgi:hypothetical protein
VSTGLWLGESTATGTVCRTMADATALATTLTDCAQELTDRAQQLHGGDRPPSADRDIPAFIPAVGRGVAAWHPASLQ